MATIQLSTIINAPIEKCFDVSRDVGIHTQIMQHTNEIAIAGRTSGLCELNDEITWQATHFGIRQKMSVKIVEMHRPRHFSDKMLNGAFKTMHHHHYFDTQDGKTIMTDVFKYEIPFGWVGNIFDRLVLKSYMTRLLQTRNAAIKKLAETTN